MEKLSESEIFVIENSSCWKCDKIVKDCKCKENKGLVTSYTKYHETYNAKKKAKSEINKEEITYILGCIDIAMKRDEEENTDFLKWLEKQPEKEEKYERNKRVYEYNKNKLEGIKEKLEGKSLLKIKE